MAWKKISSKYVLKNRWIKVRQDDVDVGGKVLDYYILEDTPDVIVGALTDKKELLFIKIFKPGIWKEVIELPAGYIDKNKSAKQAAVSELKEETGYSAGKIEKIGELYRSPARSTQVTSVFLAQDLTKGKQNLEVDEKGIKVTPIKIDKAIKMIKKGRNKRYGNLCLCVYYR